MITRIRAAHCDDGLLLAAAARDSSVTGAEEGVGPTGTDCYFAEDAGEVAVPVARLSRCPWTSRLRS